MWSVAIFAIALIGIIALIGLKHWERKYKPGFISSLWKNVDAKVIALSVAVRVLPVNLRAHIRALSKSLIFRMSAVMLRVIHFMERKLIRIINMVRGRGEAQGNGTASAFLNELSSRDRDHMDTLQK